MSLGNVLGAAAPIAAGYFTGGTSLGIGGAIAAGAATGMGIAALNGNDVLMGGVTGGLGGYGGANMAAASTAAKEAAQGTLTDAAFNKAAQQGAMGQQLTNQAAYANAGGSLGGMTAQPTALQGSGGSFLSTGSGYAPELAKAQSVGTSMMSNPTALGSTQALQTAGPTAEFGKDYGFSDIATELGDGEASKGYMKAGISSLPVLAAAFTEEEDFDWDEDRPDKYDPDATLNINDQDSGINAALKEDSGLRLYADGGIVNQTPMNVNNAGANVTGGGMNVNNVGANMGLNSVANLNQGASNIQGLGGLNVNSGAMGLSAEQQDLIDNPKYRLEGTGLYGQQKYVPNSYRGIGQYQDDLMGTTQKAGEAEAVEIAALQKQLEGSGTMNVNDVGSNVMSGGMNVNNLPTATFAMGGLTQGPGDGMSDDIPTTIDNNQPAALSDGEFVVPADVVSHLGNGSTEAGSKQLYAMMDEVRQARTGRKQQGTEIDPERYMPA